MCGPLTFGAGERKYRERSSVEVCRRVFLTYQIRPSVCHVFTERTLDAEEESREQLLPSQGRTLLLQTKLLAVLLTNPTQGGWLLRLLTLMLKC